MASLLLPAPYPNAYQAPRARFPYVVRQRRGRLGWLDVGPDMDTAGHQMELHAADLRVAGECAAAAVLRR